MDRRAEQNIFVAYRDAPERRVALRTPKGAPERYRLFGLDELNCRGARTRHNLERSVPGWARAADRALNRVVYGGGGYGGDFASVLASLRTINRADVVFSTVDTVGIPFVLLKRMGWVRPQIVYVAIGLPERLEQLRGERVRRFYADAFRRVRAIVAYAESEVERIRAWLGTPAPPVHFVPFGVDIDVFRPQPEIAPGDDVVSIGADPRRDFELLFAVARRLRDRSFRVVATRERARLLDAFPANVTVECDLALDAVRDRLASARVVALPVRDNSYSGATTTLLQAMAMAKPVVVSRTDAIATGYALEDRANCRLVSPGNPDVFERAISELLADAGAAHLLGTRARETVERSFTWERYTDALWRILSA